METLIKPMLLKPAEAAHYLDVSLSTLNRWVKVEKILTPVKMGGKTLRFKKSDLDALLNGKV